MIKLFAFLGNPGPGYARNRHNAGRLLTQSLPFFSSLSLQKKFSGLYSAYECHHFLMPETYMNLSGNSVLAAAAFFKINIEEIIIIHDELELPLGTISLKYSGGLGGHNGLRSINKSFNSTDFWRLRIGIGRPEDINASLSVYDWVLSDFSETEREMLAPALDAGANLLVQILSCEPEPLLTEWKKKKIQAFAPENGENKEIL